MKIFAFLATVVMTAFSFQAVATPLEDFCPHLSTNAPIIWQAPTNSLPKSFWIYRRLPPRPFSAIVISNAMVLASLQSKGFPKSSTNAFFIWSPPNPCGTSFSIFSIQPVSATISFSPPEQSHSTNNIPDDDTIVKRAWTCAAQLGIDPAQIAFKEMTSRFNQDENGNDVTNQLCGRGVFLSRKLDGILFWGNGENGDNDGFWIEFGSHGQVRAFSLVGPDLKRNELQSTASSQQIIACIRAFKTMTPPNGDEPDYFGRLKKLTKTKKLIITKITPYYGEGIYGETPTNDEPSKIIAPFAELEAVADFGNSNMPVRLFSPILSAQVNKLLG
ncbi:MAG: hypothetical protein ACREFE_13830 [Limisphaerales bacterium]